MHQALRTYSDRLSQQRDREAAMSDQGCAIA